LGYTTASLSDAEIAKIVDELGPELAGAVVGKVHDLADPGLVVELGRARLVLSAHPRASRLHLAPAAPARRERPAPSAFAMLCRKRLCGLRLQALRVLAPGERVVELVFGPERDRLVAELTGPHANVFLVDAAGAIVASLRPSSSTTRPLEPGRPYSPPQPAPPHARWRGLLRFGDPPGVAARAAAHYEEALRRAAEEAQREAAGAELRRAIDRLARRERALEGDLARAREAATFRKYGDLLLAHLGELPGRGAALATVPDDFEDGAPLTIPLDPTLDGRANAARYYRQYKRLTGGVRRIEERLAATRAAREARERQLGTLATLPSSELAALVPAAPPRARRRRPDAAAPRLPYREYQSLAGNPIWVGRSAADNDAMTFRHARGNDLWLHVRDSAGPHVVVPLRTRQPVSEATLLDAATLAAHFSPLGREAQVDVAYTYVKNLRKPRSAPAGAVYVADAKTIRLRLERTRVERLLSREDEE
jgi:predicted ribosome quality control (RQC) complex YloA/Tae2 family protein